MHTRKISLVTALLLITSCTASALHEPLPNTASRPTPLFFGLHVTTNPEENPITPPERFSGYHVGLDFEVSKEELDAEVPVFAICDGTVTYSGFAEGYGGLLAQKCTLSGSLITVLYGHLTVESLPRLKSVIAAGDQIGTLGAARSRDTDGNRKHLHLGIHKGENLIVLGYVKTEEEIKNFVNPADVIPKNILENIIGPKIEPYWKTGSGSFSK